MRFRSGEGRTFRLTFAARRRGSSILVALLAFFSSLNAASAGEVYHSGDFDVRWDNTFRYTAAVRLFSRDSALVANPNWDDGDRDFAPGFISDRLDLLSELDMTDGDFGLRVSAAGWYDSIYRERNDNDSPATFNPFSVPHYEFTRGVRRELGAGVQLGDAFVHGAFELGGMPLSFRLGRYALVWGESVFFGDNSIAAAQAPLDTVKELGEPGIYAKDVFLPVWQASVALQPASNVTLEAYYQFQWRKDLIPGSGSYFSYTDYLDAGGERIILSPGRYLYRQRDVRAPDTGQFGVSLQLGGGDFNYGFYALRFNAKEPQVYLFPGAGSRGAGSYRLVYPAGIDVYGASFSGYLGDSAVAGEVSVRRNMPLIGGPLVVPEGETGGGRPLYATGDTLHAQVSTADTFAASPLWDRADLDFEIAANDRLSVTRNRAALDTSRDRFAAAFQATFEPRYFEVLAGLDVGVPIGFGYGLVGRSSTDETQNAGAGNVEIGISGAYRAVWQASLTFTHFIGSPARQRLADRDFVAFNVQRTF